MNTKILSRKCIGKDCILQYTAAIIIILILACCMLQFEKHLSVCVTGNYVFVYLFLISEVLNFVYLILSDIKGSSMFQ